jgi:transposase InsO family protein
VQQARNLALTPGERSGDIRFVIRDRGSDFTASFDAVLQAAGTKILRSAVRAPRMNAICERLAGTVRRELVDRVLILGEAHLRQLVAWSRRVRGFPARSRPTEIPQVRAAAAFPTGFPQTKRHSPAHGGTTAKVAP